MSIPYRPNTRASSPMLFYLYTLRLNKSINIRGSYIGFGFSFLLIDSLFSRFCSFGAMRLLLIGYVGFLIIDSRECFKGN